MQDLEVRVGDSPNIQRNRLCAWFPGIVGKLNRSLNFFTKI